MARIADQRVALFAKIRLPRLIERYRPVLSRAGEVLWTLQAPYPVEVLRYTPEEYSRKKQELGIVRVASEEGIDLLAGLPTTTEANG
ncbi:MAG: hypothetical protein AAB225_07030 [Acidobacteriota bacterium]